MISYADNACEFGSYEGSREDMQFFLSQSVAQQS